MSRRWALLERFEVPHFDQPDVNYLVRWRLISTPFVSIYLHRIGTPDSRPTLHDHPWSFVSIILRGGYDEVRRDAFTGGTVVRRRRFVNIMRRDDAHYIAHLLRVPTWSLLFVGRRRREWGYWRGHGGSWRWVRFDQDEHALDFDRAVARRREVTHSDGGQP